MKEKRGNLKLTYNMQSTVNSETELICAITISQSPTDHYELPSIITNAINNIGKKNQNSLVQIQPIYKILTYHSQ